ncbi:hypothetical protein KKB99_03435 [bacterium]|nr:hypothetical protein [bacterium]MBU1025043.1 hypothetical protein [bacterium]
MKVNSKIYLDNPTDEARSKLMEFFNSISFGCDFMESASEADITIDYPEGKEVCASDLLHARGRMSCPNAFKAADKLGIRRVDMGKLANLLEIRICGCQLGCFE